MNRAITPFRIDVPESDLAELRRRLSDTRWPESETVDDWSQGTPLAYTRELCDFWATKYDWRATEARLNALPQFRTEIDGLGIHFLHVRSDHPNALPLVLTHGWPSSVVEFVDVIGALTDPPDPRDAFDVVIPSLPGHGFSDRPASTGWTVHRIADAWAELMASLGYERYGAHGGDWGSWVSAALGTGDPRHVAGIHLTMPLARPPADPAQVEYDERDQAAMAKMAGFGKGRSGYAAIQSTRPQALGYGLADSPAGQLAWMIDRFWEWAGHDGELEAAVSRDRLLDMVCVYWLTCTGASSARLFWESFDKEAMEQVDVPTGCSVTPNDAWLPRAWARQRFTDLRYWKDLPSGGHFLALEEPAVLAGELRTFFRDLR